jgi:hypothetical protein
MKIKVSFQFLLLITLIKPLQSQNYPSYFFPQHIRPSDPQIAALGFTGTAYRDGLFAPYSNPAGLASIKCYEFGFTRLPSHTVPFWGDDEEYFGQYSISFGMPINKSIAVGIYYFDVDLGEVTKLDQFGNITKKTKTGIRQYQVSGAVKYEFNKKISVSIGSNIKYLNNYYNLQDGICFLYDIGIRTNMIFESRYLLFGLSFNNLGEDIKYDYDKSEGIQDTEDVVKLFKIGIGFGNSRLFPAKNSNKPQYLFSVEYQQNFKSKMYSDLWKTIGCGFELSFFNHLFCQVGYIYDLNNEKHEHDFEGVTYGFGFKTPEDIKLIKPISISLSYGRGIKLGVLDVNIISLSIGYNLL